MSGKQLNRFILSLQQPEQERFHTTKPGDAFYDPFYKPYGPTPWTSGHKTRVDVTHVNVDGKDELTYRFDTSHHMLIRTYHEWSSPEIKVKADLKECVQIAFCTNVGNAPFRKGEFRIGGEHIQGLDDVYYDQCLQYYRKPDETENIQEDIGNVPMLQDWQHTLPSYPFDIKHQWMYNENWNDENDVHNSIPLLFFEGKSVEHLYQASLELKDILRMRVMTEEGVWQILETPEFDYLEGVDENTKLEIPRMWAFYASFKDEEVQRRKDELIRYYQLQRSGQDTEGLFNGEYHYTDMVAPDHENPVQYGEAASVNLHTETACTAILWTLRNVQAAKKGCRSNYTTNCESIKDGWAPIGSTSLKFGDYTVFEGDFRHFSKGHPSGAFSSRPYAKGYAAHSIAIDSRGKEPGCGLVLAGTKAVLKINCKNTDIFINESHVVKKNGPTIRLLAKKVDLLGMDESSSSSKKVEEPKVRVVKPDEEQTFLPCVRLRTRKWFRIVPDATGFKIVTDICELNESRI